MFWWTQPWRGRIGKQMDRQFDALHAKTGRPSIAPERLLRDAERGDARRSISQRQRKWIEGMFGWAKLDRGLRQVKLRGLEKVDWLFVFSCAAHNLLRLPRLMAQQQPARLREQRA